MRKRKDNLTFSKMKNRHTLTAVIVTAMMATAHNAVAQNADGPRTEITNTKLIGVGASQILDTYISPEHYDGTEFRFVDNTERRRNSGGGTNAYSKWSTDIRHRAFVSHTSPRSDDSKDIAGLYTFGMGRHRHWDLAGGSLHLKAGITGQASIGFLYNTRNGNNPGQLRTGINLSPSAAAVYDFRLFGKRFSVEYEVTAPLVGLMFTPHYGQSYYEILTRGNYDHNIVATTPFNAPSMQNALTLQMHLRHLSVSVGYLGDYRQSDVNNLKYHNYSHLVVVGLTKRFYIVKL